MTAEEVAKADEGPDLALHCRRRHVLKDGQFLFSRLDALRSENKPQIGYLRIAEKALGEVDLEVMIL